MKNRSFFHQKAQNLLDFCSNDLVREHHIFALQSRFVSIFVEDNILEEHYAIQEKREHLWFRIELSDLIDNLTRGKKWKSSVLV